MKEIEKILDSNEHILWEGKPVFGPYFFTGAIGSFLTGLFILIFLTPFIAVNFAQKTTIQVQKFDFFFLAWNVFLIPFIFGGLSAIFGTPIYKILVHKHLYYVITNKRVIIQKGILARSFEYIDFDKITNAEVVVGFWDNLMKKNSGSIYINSSLDSYYTKNGQQVTRPHIMNNISDPYSVFKLFKKVSYDIKTDIEYPNNLRPTENNGYNTNYNIDKK